MKPFLKWVGGKTRLLSEIRKLTPGGIGTYYEPFVGGGAVFFDLLPDRAVLSDSNHRLMRTYQAVQTDCERVIALLSSYPVSREFYNELKAIQVDSKSDVEVAAWLIYLNRTGYNGLYRVNSKNQYNVSWGRYRDPVVCDADLLRACSKALKHAVLKCTAYHYAVKGALPGDWIYFDPPYLSKFNGYQPEAGWKLKDHEYLRDVAACARARVLISQTDCEEIRRIYQAFEIHQVTVPSTVGAAHRGVASELLIAKDI